MLGELDCPGRLAGNRRHFAVHVEELALVQAERLDDVLEGVGVDGFFKCLAQQILAALGIGKVPVDCEHDVVGDQRLRRCKEA